MQRPEQMDEIVSIMAQARDEHRRLSHNEAKHLDKLLQHIFHQSK